VKDQPRGSIGRWRRENIRSLDQICAHALRLENTSGGLLGALLAPSPYPDIVAARQALRAHPIYQTLKTRLPRLLGLAPAAAPLTEFRLVQTLLRYTVLATSNGEEGRSLERTDKRSAIAYRAIERVEGYLADGAVVLSNPARREMLAQLLAEAREELAKPKRRARKQPALLGLAHALIRLGIKPDGAELTDVAKMAGVVLDERTARRYVREAIQRRSRPDK
jgi:hypothetical protein